MGKVTPIPYQRKNEDIAYDFLKSFVCSICICIILCILILILIYQVIEKDDTGSE